MMKSKGFSLIGFLYFIMTLGVFLYLVLAIGPMYLENHNVKNALKGIQTRDLINSHTQPAQVKQRVKLHLAKNFRIHNVTHVEDNDIQVKRTQRGYLISVAYDVKKPIVANIAASLSFDDHVEVTF